MNTIRLMRYFRINADKSIAEYCRQFTPHKPSSWFKLRIAEHYTNEASDKFNIIWENVMGKGKSNSWQGTTKFCAISLDTEGKEKARAWLEKNGKDIDTLATDMVRDGWKTTFTWDADNDCFIASATQRDEDHRNYDICVTSRAGTMWDALMLNYYKIYVLYKNQSLPTERAKNSFG